MTEPRAQPFDEYELTVKQIDALRDLRAEAQVLKLAFDNAKSGLRELREYAPFVWRTYFDMARHCATLRDTNIRSPDDRKSKSDSISAIINRWEYLVIVVPAILGQPVPPAIFQEWIGEGIPLAEPAHEPERPDHSEQPAGGQDQIGNDPDHSGTIMLRRLAEADAALRFIVTMVGYLTIPDRINRWLGRTETEDVVSFHRIFEDELPDEADRLRVLGLLASSPKRIPLGIIDPITGLIYRCPPQNSWVQAKLLLQIAAAIALCFAMLTAYLVMAYPDTTNWYPTWGLSDEGETMISAWLTLLGGMAVQRVVARRKSKDPTAAELRLTLTRAARFAAAKATRIVETLVLSVVAIILYYASTPAGTASNDILTLSNAFFLGYGFDSALDLMSSEFERRSSSTAQAKPKLN